MKLFFNDRILVASLLLTMAMASFEVTVWMSVFSALALLWRWGCEFKGWPRLSRKVTGALSFLLFVGVLIQFRTLIGQEPSFTFLLGLTALKIIDYANERDHKFVILLGFVLLAEKALFSLDVYWLLPTFGAFVGLWLSMFPTFFAGRGKVFAKIFVASAPLGVALFILFPRFVLPWALSQAPEQAEAGFSDDLMPGRFASLATNNRLVFRAKISKILTTRDLYWRGSVLTNSQGLHWRSRFLTTVEAKSSVGGDQLYEVALEPGSQRFLFVLDGTEALQINGQRHLNLEGDIFRLVKPTQKTLVYQGHVREGPWRGAIDPEPYLQTPALSKKVLEWVEDVKKKSATAKERLTALQKLFSEEGFVYTLSPGSYGDNALEEFLFDRKKGFCEHFAGSYATLARALGWPARVVIGYQGGRYNPWGEFWSILQQDAHAWVEIYQDGVWVQMDPTQWVAPLRLEIGAEDFFALTPEDQVAFSKKLHWRPANKEEGFYLDAVVSFFDSLNYQWTYFLLEFDRGVQLEFIRSLKDSQVLRDLLKVAGILVALSVFAIWSYNYRRKNPLERKFKKLEAWGEQRGLPRHTSEPPLTYIERLISARNDVPAWVAPLAQDINNSYRFPLLFRAPGASK